MKFENCLIASDFDGTFYADDGSVPRVSLDAIRYYLREGGYFTVCTGRVRNGFHRYDPAYINAPVLLANGACAYDFEKKEYVMMSAIGEEGVLLIRALCRAFPDMAIELYSPEHVYALEPDDATIRHFKTQAFSYTVIESPEEAELPWCKVMLGAYGRSAEVQAFVRRFTDDPACLPTTGDVVEIMKKGVNKGSGLLRLADRLHVPHERVFAVGDGYNDVDMLRAARYGFVPSNGSAEAFAAADYVVRSNNEGAIAHVIEILDRVL